MVDGRPRAALSFDVEEWFQTSAASAAYGTSEWRSLESRVQEPMEYLLKALRSHGATATFFFLGWVVERLPNLARMVLDDDHELASHGYGHGQITFQSPVQLTEDLELCERAFANAGLPRPRGYRAPSFTVVRETTWALRVLSEKGYVYDSSVYPMFRHRYGFPQVPIRPFLFSGEDFSLLEMPMAVCPFLGARLPAAGGAYLRFMPGLLFRFLLSRVSKSGRTPVLYMHPWELDGGMRLCRSSLLQRFRQESGSGRPARRKLESILERYSCVPLRSLADGLSPDELDVVRVE